MLSLYMCGSWTLTSMLVSSPISPRGDGQSLLGFLASLRPLWLLAATSAQRQEASVCRRCSQAALPSGAGLKPLLLHCAEYRARSVPLTAMSRGRHAALSHGVTHTKTRARTPILECQALLRHSAAGALLPMLSHNTKLNTWAIL